jgi:UDP-N-acetylmuramate dehydrogenase
MNIQQNVPLAPLTSLGVGGNAEILITLENNEDMSIVLPKYHEKSIWVLGFGTNSLISDRGLPGVTLLTRSNKFEIHDSLLVADSGVWWDDIVQHAISQNKWGIELMSAIPGGVGASVVGNIAAYGQAVSDTLSWVEVFDTRNSKLSRLTSNDLSLDYRYSAFQTPEFSSFIITRAAFKLFDQANSELSYQSAIDVAKQENYNISTLEGRRQTIIKAREQAGSLWDYRDKLHDSQNAGSFFRNPIVSTEQAETIMKFDETGKSTTALKRMNQVHGGNEQRVSAALVLLAAGFKRGQTWGPVRLHEHHVLKIENTGGATAQQIYDVVQEIVTTVKTKLGIDLIPEPRFLGEF